MYNIIKCNLIDESCPCEYCYSLATPIPHSFIDLHIYIGEGIENPELRAFADGYGEEWVLPEVMTWRTDTGESTGYKDGWYATRVDYDDFAKNTAGDPWLEIRAYPNAGEEMLPGVIYLQHSGLQSDGNWVVTQAVGTFNAYNVRQASTSSGGSSGGGGSSLTPGEGIDITDNTISVKPATDTELGGVKQGKNVTIDEDGTINAEAGEQVTIENAVVIRQSDSSYILHNFTEVEYIAGNKIGYTGTKNPIIIQGLTVYAGGSTAPNGMTIKDCYSKNLSEIPDVPIYMGADFSPYGLEYLGSELREITGITCYLNTAFPEYNDYRYAWKYISLETGKSGNWGNTISTYDNFAGVTLTWTKIVKPGSVYTPNSTLSTTRTFEYGYAICRLWRRYKSGETYYFNNLSDCNFAVPFASEAEYNAAVGLTYEPQTLSMVIDTQEVTG